MAFPTGIIYDWNANSLTSTLTDGALVVSITDAVSGVALSQATPANQPTFKANGVNGYPTIVHNDTSTFLTTPSLNALPAWTFLVVAKTSGTQSSYFLTAGSVSNAIITDFLPGKWEYYANPRSEIGNTSITFQTISTNVGTTAPGVWNIGQSGGNPFWAGEWTRLIVWNRALSAAEMTQAVNEVNLMYFPVSGVTWGSVTGTLSNQTDLQNALNAKQAVLGFTAENVANKSVVNGYAALDQTGKVPTAQLPDSTGGSTYNTTVNLTGGNLVATSGYASLEAAFAAINATDAPLTTLMVNSVIPLTVAATPPANIQQPANITLYFVGGGRVNRTTATTLTELQFNCDDSYQICFSGFLPGQIKFGNRTPAEISPCWFGAAANKFGGNFSAYGSGVDTLNAVRTIEYAYTLLEENGFIKGTATVFPAGDFTFSRDWENTVNQRISGVEANRYWAHATRLLFPNTGHGIVQKKRRGADGQIISRNEGNMMTDFEIRGYGSFYTDSAVRIGGSRTFLPSDVNTTTGTITIAGHYYETGNKVNFEYAPVDGSAIGGLNNFDNGLTYYVIKTDANTIRLATTRANALAGVAVTLTGTGAVGGGVTHHRIRSRDVNWVSAAITGTHIVNDKFNFPLNNGDTFTHVSAEGKYKHITILRSRRSVQFFQTVAGGSTTVFGGSATGTAGSFTQDDVDSEFTTIASINTRIVAVSADGASATLAASHPPTDATFGISAYLTNGRRMVVKPIEFVLRVSTSEAPITTVGTEQWQRFGGHNTIVNNSNLAVGQRVQFYHQSGNPQNDFVTTVKSVEGEHFVSVSPPLPERFTNQGLVLIFCQALDFAPTASLPVRLNKWSGMFLEHYNYGLIKNVRTVNINGDGVCANTDPTQLFQTGNCNMVRMVDCFFTESAGNGVQLNGQDSNACILENLNCIGNGGTGVWDESYLGCTISKGHYADNTGGTIYTARGSGDPLEDKATTMTLISGIYTEGGSIGLNLGSKTVVIAGEDGVGFHPESQHAVGITSGGVAGNAALSGGLAVASQSGKMSAILKGRSANRLDNSFLVVGGHTPQSLQTASDWNLSNGGDLGSVGYVGVGAGNGIPNDYILAWDFINRRVITRGELRVGDGTNDRANHSGLISGTAAPADGAMGYAKGFIILNRAPAAGGFIGWTNVGTATSASWKTFGAIAA